MEEEQVEEEWEVDRLSMVPTIARCLPQARGLSSENVAIGSTLA